MYLDGQQIGIKPITVDYTNSQYVTSYVSLFNGVGKDNRDEGNDIDREEYANGYALYAFNLSPDNFDKTIHLYTESMACRRQAVSQSISSSPSGLAGNTVSAG